MKEIEKRLRIWSPHSTFHEIVWNIKENLRLYEEYVNNFTKATQLVEVLSRKKDRKSDRSTFSEFQSITKSCTIPETGEVLRVSYKIMLFISFYCFFQLI